MNSQFSQLFPPADITDHHLLNTASLMRKQQVINMHFLAVS